MNLPDNAKIWIFQANRDFSHEEKYDIEKALNHFIGGWKSHGADLSADFSLPYNRFIVVGVDENQTAATGCSVDKLTNLIKLLDKKYNLELLNRMLVSLYEDNKITSVTLDEFKDKLKNNELLSTVEIFNTGICNYFEFRTRFLLPVKDSWASKMRFNLN